MKTRHTICIILFFLLGGMTLKGQEKATYPFVERDSTLYLDVHRPAMARDDRAAVITVFGGGFFTGSRDDKLQQRTAELLTERGFTVISIDYRLGMRDQAKVEENKGLLNVDKLFQYCVNIAAEDCAAAVAWVCAHADELGIDTTKIVLEGCSAGAIAVLQLDYCRANGLEQASELPKGWKPAAVVPYSGGLLCRKKDLHYETAPAPTMLMHGTKDKIVTYNSFGIPSHPKLFGANQVSKAMRHQDIPHWIVRFEGIGHEVASWLPGSVDFFCGFVNQALAGRITTLDATMTDSKLRPTEWTDMSVQDLYRRR